MRHSLNHMQSAMARIYSNYNNNENESSTIEYDKRERGTDLETKTTAAVMAISDLEKDLHRIVDLHTTQSTFDLDREEISCTFKLDPIEAEDQTFKSTCAREIAFSIHHAIHHLAMIRLILKAQGASTSELENLGVAPATEEYNLKQQ